MLWRLVAAGKQAHRFFSGLNRRRPSLPKPARHAFAPAARADRGFRPPRPESRHQTPGDYPSAVAFYFNVTIEGSRGNVDASFQDVSGLSVELETETYVEGGGNAFGYRLPKGVKYQNLVLSRGMAPTSSKLIEWCKQVLEGGLADDIKTKSLKVSLLGPGKAILHSWSFTGAYPVKWQAESFNSQKNDVAIEKIELAFSSFTREIV